MLTVYENRFNFFILKVIAFINFLPITVVPSDSAQSGEDAEDAEEVLRARDNLPPVEEPAALDQVRLRSTSGEVVTDFWAKYKFRLSLQSVGWRVWSYKILYGFYHVHGFYIFFRLGHSRLDGSKWKVHHFPVHFFWGLFCTVFQFWAYTSFFVWPERTVSIVNDILSHLPDKIKTRPMTHFNKQELLAMTIGICIAMTDVVMVTVLASDPTRLQLFHSLIPEMWQSTWTFLFCLVLEAICATYFCTIGYFVLLIHLMFFEMANCHLKQVQKETRIRHERRQFSNADSLRACREVRRLQLLIQLFNHVNCFMIFSFKFMCITLAIVGSFFTIRYSVRYPAMGLFCVVVSMDALTFFGFIYERAFMIPDNIETVKERILLAVQGIPDKRRIKELSRVIRSFPKVGIKVGEFHTMERVSTLIFIHFVVCQVVSMLVAFH